MMIERQGTGSHTAQPVISVNLALAIYFMSSLTYGCTEQEPGGGVRATLLEIVH